MYNQQHSEISLRRFSISDISKVFQLSQEENLARFLPDQVYRDIAEASEVVQSLISTSEEINIERGPYVLGVILNGAELIGHVGVSRIEEGIEIGYSIEKQHQGCGYAKQAVYLMLQLFESYTSINEIYGIVDLKNDASRKVLESCGFSRVGMKRDKEVYKKVITHAVE